MEIYKILDTSNLDGEVWKVITDFPDYKVSNLGRVKSLKFKKEKILKQQKNKKCYLLVRLCKNGKKQSRYTHHLVFENFNNYKLKNNYDIHHINENKQDNMISNLELMSHSIHSINHNTGTCKSEETKKKISKNHIGMKGKSHTKETKNKISETKKEKFRNKELSVKGTNNPNYKLLKEQVAEIDFLLKENKLTQDKICKLFKISKSTIYKIKTGKHWGINKNEIIIE